MKSKRGQCRSDLALGIFFAALVSALGAYANYTLPYDPDPVATPSTVHLLFCSLLYAPLVLFVILADWRVKDFGFSITRRVGLATLPVVSVCALTTAEATVSWQSALFEAFARTGEELFFRGFLFLLLSKLFEKKTRPALWAVLTSAAVFTLVHTQTFQASFLSSYGAGPIGYRIFERLLNIFLLSVILGLLRHWAQSILPVAIAHTLINGGLLALPFCLAIYAGIVLWAYLGGEDVLSNASLAPPEGR